ncbi:MAG TPA: hypothetical protein VIH75_23415 [Candidatus Sulfotelmatobacter sp.]
MALGATRSSVVAMVLDGVLGQILIGLGLGIPAALFTGHLMAPALRCGRVRSLGSGHCKLSAWLLRNHSRFSPRAPRCFDRTNAGPPNGIE